MLTIAPELQAGGPPLSPLPSLLPPLLLKQSQPAYPRTRAPAHQRIIFANDQSDPDDNGHSGEALPLQIFIYCPDGN